ncbi:MAG: hypothetical protein ACFUZC_17395 [Chthoniobacteraceae bacterium]
MKTWPSQCGFSLVEIVLSLGIVSFAIMAILGVLSVGVNSNKDSLDESTIAAMSRQVIGNLRQQQFDASPVFTQLLNSPSVCYFDGQGTRLWQNGVDIDSATAEASGSAVYQCTVTATNNLQYASNSSLPCLLDLTLKFEWPIRAKAPSSYVIYMSLARYY